MVLLILLKHWDSKSILIYNFVNGFCKTANVMHKNGLKINKDGRHLLKLTTSCKGTISRNTKEHFKWVICEATVFLLF